MEARDEIMKLLIILRFEEAQDFLRDNAELTGDLWDRARKAIPEYLEVEKREDGDTAVQVRKLGGMFGVGVKLLSEAVKEGDEAPKRIRRLQPIAQIVYEAYLAEGGKPYTEEQLRGFRAAARARREAARREAAGGVCPGCGQVHSAESPVAPNADLDN